VPAHAHNEVFSRRFGNKNILFGDFIGLEKTGGAFNSGQQAIIPQRTHTPYSGVSSHKKLAINGEAVGL